MRPVELLMALILDGLIGEPRSWHPLVGFGHLARCVERLLNIEALAPTFRHTQAVMNYGLGSIAVLLVAVPVVLLVVVGLHLRLIAPLLSTAALYMVLGHRSLHEHARAVERELNRLDLEAARRQVGMLVSRDTHDMDAHRISAATVESILENGNDALFGALFWFMIAGAPGALAYRLINTLDAMWGYRTARYRHFGWAAARVDDVANLIPARLTALSYAIVGHTKSALRCWREQAPRWDSPNAGPVMASGAGALGVQLGGGAFYHGRWRERPVLGAGRAACCADISRAEQLLMRALLLWVFSLFLVFEITRWLHA
jgi:adenosylcobinamide-phosphate synthase